MGKSPAKGKTPLERALNNMKQRLDEAADGKRWKQERRTEYMKIVEGILKPFSALKGANAALKRIARAGSFQDCEDYIAEAEYALALAAVGFDVQIEPDGAKGPDLALTKDGVTARAEVRRIRDAGEKYMIDPTHRQIRPGLRVVSYWGDIDAGAKKVLSCIKEKFRQVADDSSIILMVVEDSQIDDAEFDRALENLEKELRAGTVSLPPGLQYVVLAERFADRNGPRVHVARVADGDLPDWSQLLMALVLRH